MKEIVSTFEHDKQTGYKFSATIHLQRN